jgi:DNA-binding LytR/AlgR family response regulator
LKDGTNILMGSHLKAVEGLLPERAFMRVHRSFVVSLKAVTSILGNVVEIGKTQIPIGGSFKEELFKTLNIK